MNLPKNYLYSKDHEWLDDKSGLVGVTGFAIEQLGDIVHLDLPEVGASFGAGDPFGTIESTKTVSDLYMPVSGTVTEVNQEIGKKLESLAGDPYKNGWLVKIAIKDRGELGGLMSSETYEETTSGH